jgi:hypothetical protein
MSPLHTHATNNRQTDRETDRQTQTDRNTLTQEKGKKNARTRLVAGSNPNPPFFYATHKNRETGGGKRNGGGKPRHSQTKKKKTRQTGIVSRPKKKEKNHLKMSDLLEEIRLEACRMSVLV